MSELIKRVQAQLDAYNGKDMTALLECYAVDARIRSLNGELLACGHAEIAKRMQQRFDEPDLHAVLLSRQQLDDWVVDCELIRRQLDQGQGWVRMLCLYQVKNDRIVQAVFHSTSETLD